MSEENIDDLYQKFYSLSRKLQEVEGKLGDRNDVSCRSLSARGNIESETTVTRGIYFLNGTEEDERHTATITSGEDGIHFIVLHGGKLTVNGDLEVTGAITTHDGYVMEEGNPILEDLKTLIHTVERMVGFRVTEENADEERIYLKFNNSVINGKVLNSIYRLKEDIKGRIDLE